jgi:hypothetical protein
MIAKAAIQKGSRFAFIKRHPDILVLISVVSCGVVCKYTNLNFILSNSNYLFFSWYLLYGSQVNFRSSFTSQASTSSLEGPGRILNNFV